ncbi:MAG: hypothetical protein AAGJ87_14025, partial [Pseudomonadota bacterium]
FGVRNDDEAIYAADIVLNAPDLSNRPLRVGASQLDPATIPALCANRSIAIAPSAAFEDIRRLWPPIKINVDVNAQLATVRACDTYIKDPESAEGSAR